MTGKLSSSVFYVLFGLMLFWANANAELPANVKFCIPKQYRVTYDCPAGGNAPTQQTTAYGNNFTTGVGCNNAPAWRVDDSDTIITSNTTIPYAYTHDIVLHADYSSLYTIAGDKLINADPDVYLTNSLTMDSEMSPNVFIDTGIYPNQDTRVVVSFVHTSIGNIFGARLHGTGDTFSFMCTTKGFYRSDYNMQPLLYTNNIPCPQNERVIVDKNKNITTITTNSGDVEKLVHALGKFQSPSTLTLYALHMPDLMIYNVVSPKIYYVYIYDNDELIRNMVPVPAGLRIGDYTVPSNGMWDMVEQKFYQNSGTGEFIYGRD
ncbi:MAG: hypothetical protein IJ560_04350 [Alphaproteobacteria bacterium]|nr:hypothetical protein [Alphaproteobacteria bacterium]